jgi:hypothetical protein
VYGLKVSVGFEVLTAVAMKIAVSWDVTPCSSAKVHFYRTSPQCIPEDSTLLSNLISALMRCPQLHTKAVNCLLYVGFEILTAVVMKSSVFWDIMRGSPLEVRISTVYTALYIYVTHI